MPHNFSFVIPKKLAGMGLPGLLAPLDSDLAQLKKYEIGALVSLTEDALDEELVRQFGFVYLHLPIIDFSPPRPEQIEQFVSFTREQNARQCAVAVHCAGGYGRTGTMLACYLVFLGESAKQALASIRTLRPGSIETSEQMRAVADYEKQRGHDRK